VNIVDKKSYIKITSLLFWHDKSGHISKERIDRLLLAKILSPVDVSGCDTCADCTGEKLTKIRKQTAHYSHSL
jgi:hypothetical protein